MRGSGLNRQDKPGRSWRWRWHTSPAEFEGGAHAQLLGAMPESTSSPSSRPLHEQIHTFVHEFRKPRHAHAQWPQWACACQVL
ncbi:hypothetical protein MPTK1_5g02560 [Marchantia polymorpha subsp. ruderalis]|uniref:Uncharacterized protein n=2 Tax=Marchantia polymorpha TaxID=3197 RepID=A0AAF6BE83_MARPO|nr:hypothetical protein MARPO_0124s0067 [Marchantia polymorpha]BBN10317.1 hypothetical protein Mp_5g02560 [Marchantia polymorpha subsp. ruderalis]|eukprot:PTQ30502.1 hypothetical protein MARPO_0124s0067 [Marchantia polymorpha]